MKNISNICNCVDINLKTNKIKRINKKNIKMIRLKKG
jgi:hypothetical protein